MCYIALDRAEDFAKKYGAGYATNEVAKIFADPEIDAVWISTQHDTHTPLA